MAGNLSGHGRGGLISDTRTWSYNRGNTVRTNCVTSTMLCVCREGARMRVSISQKIEKSGQITKSCMKNGNLGKNDEDQSISSETFMPLWVGIYKKPAVEHETSRGKIYRYMGSSLKATKFV